MKIGTDISIQTCRDEGYSVIEFLVRELYPNGRKNGIDRDHAVLYTVSLPLYIREEMGWCVGDTMMRIDTCVSWNALVEVYLENREGIDSMIGDTWDVENIEPTEYDIVNLASDIDSYCGLE